MQSKKIFGAWLLIVAFLILRLVETARTRIQDIFKQADEGLQNSVLKQDDLAPILLDLAMYETDDLVQGSLQLLDKIFSPELHLFQRAVQAQLLITEKSERLYQDINEYLHLLRQYLNPKIRLYSQSTPQPPTEPLITTVKSKDSESPLKKLTNKCWLEGEAIGFEPHQQNQKIIYNFGDWEREWVSEWVSEWDGGERRWWGGERLRMHES